MSWRCRDRTFLSDLRWLSQPRQTHYSREYLIYLSGPQEHYAPANKITETNLAAKLTVDLFENHAMLALTKSSGPNFDKQITAVDKYDVRLFPHFDGSIQKYPTWQRQNIQVL